MSCFLYENHWGSPTLTLLNVHSVLGVLNVQNVLHVLHTCAFMCGLLCLRWGGLGGACSVETSAGGDMVDLVLLLGCDMMVLVFNLSAT